MAPAYYLSAVFILLGATGGDRTRPSTLV